MLIDFTKAKVEQDEAGGWLCLLVKNLPMARQFVFKMKNRTYTADVKEQRKRRSKDANAYFWHLCGELADALRSSKDEVYFEMLKRYGVQEMVRVRSEGAGLLVRSIKYAEVFDHIVIGGAEFTDVLVFIGSSHYDTRQMSVLIDGVVSECKEMDIETDTPEEQARLLREWPE